MKLHELPQHHAVLITHTHRKDITDSLWSELQTISPVNRLFNQTILDIDTARSIISWAKSPQHNERVGLISFHTAGVPAQNALLKILEEPPENTRFIVITRDKETLLETVLSRLSHQAIDNETPTPASESAMLFLTTKPSQRMKLVSISKILETTDEENRKDREIVKDFILSLVPGVQSMDSDSRYIREILEIASYASDPSSSGKTLLEYLSLLLPQVKS